MARRNSKNSNNMLTEMNSEEFTLGVDGKTLQFFSNDGVKKVFEIHRYGKGKALYFKRDRTTERSIAS